jgi:PAS domain S-box-containing protein
MKAHARRILVAEDSPIQAEWIRFLLEGEGYEVQVAGDGREGLAAVSARAPDLIISDVVMPEMDGFAFCQAVKSSKATREIPFVLLTAQQTPMDILRGLERGADNFIPKPFEDQYLLERIKRIFENLGRRRKGRLGMEVTVRMGGRDIVVNADKQQIIELLFATSEELSDSNRHLEEARLALEEQARTLERKVEQRTREVAEAEARYRTLVEQLPAVVYLAAHDAVGRLLYISPQIERILGFAPTEYLSDPRLLIGQLHPDDRDAVLGHARRLRETGEASTIEFRLRARDGREVWFSDSARLVRGDGGSEPAVQGFLLDITERKRAEEALQRERAFLRQVIDTSPHFIFAKDRQGRFTLVNRAVAEAYGTTVEGLLGKTDADFNPDLEEVEAFRRDDLEVMDSGREKLVPEEVVTDATGKRRWLYTVKRPLLGPDGAAQQILGVSTDITDRKQAEDQLRQSQKIEAIGQLAGGVAHDFNNLVGVIIGYGDLLAKDLGPQHAGMRRVEQIRKAADRAAALTRQLLAFSRKQVLQPKVLDLNAVVTDFETMLRRLIPEHIQLVTALQQGLGRVKADPSQIEQVIVNLAVNARDAMPQGGRLILETTNVDFDDSYLRTHPGARPGPQVMLAVSDTGHGMDRQTQARIFEPFFTTKEPGKGTGLGLSTVYGIVKQSGGYIMVYSEPGRGSAFKVYLPRVEEDVEAPGREVAAAPPRPAASETVLLAEDEGALRAIIREILEDGGYTVLEGPTPDEALSVAHAHQGPIQLLLTDVVMPRMSGRELARQVAALRPELKVLYMSGYTDEAVTQNSVLEPGAEFVQKPFTADALLRKVRRVLDRGGAEA